MNGDPGLLNKVWKFLSALLPVLLLAGCVTPTYSRKADADLSKYRKVYFICGKNDPRDVFPRVVWRLQQTGFNVTEINLGGPPIYEQGSGFVISPEGDVLTCAHVVAGVTNATIWVEGIRYPCHVLACDTNVDLALLSVVGSHPPFHALRFIFGHEYKLGENVYTMGFPLAEVLGVSPRLDNGMVNAKVGMNDDTNYVQISVPIQPGNSGGPLLTPDGTVIGVIRATLNPMKVLVQSGGDIPQNVNFAIKVSTVQNFLQAANVNVPASDFTPETFDDAQKSLALVRCGDVSDDDLNQPALFCVFHYIPLLDVYWRFRACEIDFVDEKTGDVVFKSGQYYDSLVTEDKELNGIFSTVSTSFFPDRPNPFK